MIHKHPIVATMALVGSVFAAGASARPPDSPPVPDLPAPGVSAFRQPVVIGWEGNAVPDAPAGFFVQRFAAGLDSPRWMLSLPNGDVLVAQSRTERLAGFPSDVLETLTRRGLLGKSANNVILLRRTRDGVRQHVFIEGLHQPFGMALDGNDLYVANTDALVRFHYTVGATRINAEPETLIAIPTGERPGYWNNHWTRNVVVGPGGDKLYLSVGAGTNVNEEGVDPPDRAAIWEINSDGSGKRLFATGLRNPTGMGFDPATGDLWTTVNERDGLGEDVPPDYLTRVAEGAFYGWPYVYFGTYPDPTHARLSPKQVMNAAVTARVPDLALGAHSVPLGLVFYTGKSFPARYREGAFVARRGGVGRTRFLGFDVIFVPFENGSPTGEIESFLGGFVADDERGTVHGRPVGLAMLDDGSLLVTDDAANTIWRVQWRGDG